MMNWLDQVACDPKKRRVLMLIMGCYVLWIVYLSIDLSRSLEPFDHVLTYYDKLTKQLIFSVIPIIMGWLWMDLSHPHDRMFVSLRYPRYLWDMKWIYISMVSGLFVLFFYLIWWIIPPLWITSLTIDVTLVEPLHLWLDMLLLYLLSSCFFAEKWKTLSLIFSLFYLMFQLMMQDQPSLYLFYVLPLYQKEIMTYELVFVYKLWYIGLGFVITRYFFGKTARNG